MKSAEFFYNEQQANEFIKSLIWQEAEPEMVETEDEDTNEKVYVVYYNPPKMR